MVRIAPLVLASFVHFLFGDGVLTQIVFGIASLIWFDALIRFLAPTPKDTLSLWAGCAFRLLTLVAMIYIVQESVNGFFFFLDDETYFLKGRDLAGDPMHYLAHLEDLADELGTADTVFYLINGCLQFLFGHHFLVVWAFNISCSIAVSAGVLRILGVLGVPADANDRASWMVAFFPSLAFWSWFNLKDLLVCFLTVRFVLAILRLFEKVSLVECLAACATYYLLSRTRGYSALLLLAIAGSGFLVLMVRSVRKVTKLWHAFALFLGFSGVVGAFAYYALQTSFYDLFEFFADFQMKESEGASGALQSFMTISNPLELFRVFGLGVVHLLATPLPWQADGILHGVIPTTMELLIFVPAGILGCKALLKGHFSTRWFLLVISGLVFIYSVLWGGSSVRHRLQVEPLLLIVAAIGFSDSFVRWAYRLYIPLLCGGFVSLVLGRQAALLFLSVPLVLLLRILGQSWQKYRLQSFQKFRILEITNSGFSARHLLGPLVEKLSSEGWDVTVGFPPGVILEEQRSKSWNVIPLSFFRSMNPIRNFFPTLRLALQLFKEPYHIVHTHTPIVSFYVRVASFFACAPSVIYTAHGFYFHSRMTRIKQGFYFWAEQIASWLTDYCFSQSRTDHDNAVHQAMFPSSRIRWIGNGVSSAQFDPSGGQVSRSELRVQLGIPLSAVVFIFVGRLVREKGVFELVEAVASLRRQSEDHVLFVGESLTNDYDGVAEELHARIGTLGLSSNVHFVGYQEEVAKYLAASDVFVLPSYREGMPRSILEAMMMGLPVIATDIRGCNEEVVPGETGMLVSPCNVAELAEAMQQLAGDLHLRRRMGDSGRRRALENFREELVIERELQGFREALAT